MKVKAIRLCHNCGRGQQLYRYDGFFLCDGCIGVAMRAKSGIKPCKGCGRVDLVDDFGDCKDCAPANRAPPAAAAGRRRKAVKA
jgi:hypothetical protein